MVEIRMKPGCGKMLLARRYKLTDGTTADKRPKSMDDLLDTEETWLGERQVNPDGSVGEGPTARVPLSLLAPYLDKEGKPSRIVEGYPMTRVKGHGTEEDEHGNTIQPVSDTFKPGTLKRMPDQSLVASQQDCTFEFVRRTA
jgi:hypothetical protein